MNAADFYVWCKEKARKPLVMGVLNITPDSFSDAGSYLELDSACRRVETMLAHGVDIIDVGGESSRPGATPVSCQQELDRVIPVIEQIRSMSDICISIDTYKAQVMETAVAAGASFINDIYALQHVNALSVVAKMTVPVCLMHMQGMPLNMQKAPHYSDDVSADINQFFQQRMIACEHAGIQRERLILDPGFGFGKSVRHNLMLLQGLNTFQRHGLPVLLGVSRKSTLGVILNNQQASTRMPAGLAAAVFAILNGVNMIRTHDVLETIQAIQMINAITGDPNAY